MLCVECCLVFLLVRLEVEIDLNAPTEETSAIEFHETENSTLDSSEVLSCFQTMKTYNICADSAADANIRNNTESTSTPNSNGGITNTWEISSPNNSDSDFGERPPRTIAEDSTQDSQILKSLENQQNLASIPEKMSDSKTSAIEENTSEDLEDLLAVHVSKDYVNCVWTSEPFQKCFETDLESSPEKLVIADVTPSAQQNEEGSLDIEDSKPAEARDDHISGKNCPSPQSTTNPQVVKKKKKKVSKPKGNVKESVKKNPLKAKNKLPGEAKKKVFAKAVPPSPSKIPSEPTSAIASCSAEVASRESCEKSIFSKRKRRSVNSKSPCTLGSVKTSEFNSVSPKPSSTKSQEDSSVLSDESLFSAYKNLVVHRSLPPYAPKLTDSRFFSGTYFTCNACNDKYVMETSLAGHLSRKTANFMYNCALCEAQISFDNRCSLLNHIKSHRMDIDAIKPGDLVVLPLGANDSECDMLFRNASTSFQCPECSSLVSSLKLHLNGQDAESKSENSSESSNHSSLNCKECAYILPTKCAFTAHERFHNGQPPYLCPECGESFLRSSTLLNHMDKDCFHDHKRTVFQCGYCKIVVVSMDLFTEHLITKHLHPVYVCHICEASVGAFVDFNAHRVSQHKLAEVDPLSGTAALCAQVECDRCPGVKISLSSLQDHAISHTLDPKFMTTVYQCKDCKCMYASKALMHNHKGVCQGKREVINNSLNEISFSELPVDIMSSFQPSGSNEVVHEAQDLPGLSAGLESLQSPEGNTRQSENVLPANLHQNKLESANSVMQVQSQENKASKTDSSKMAVLKKNVICKLCRKVVSEGVDNVALKKHFSGHHFDIFMKAIHGHSTKKLPMQIVYTKSQQPPNDKERKIIQDIINSEPKSESDDASDNDSNSKVVVIKRQLDFRTWRSRLKIVGHRLNKVDGNKCYKCSFVSDNAETFKAHIVFHKSNPSDLQCPQCGMCFIVRPPLEKHLIVEHGVRNVRKYLRDFGFEDHTSDDERQMVDIEESDHEELQENQCKVCKEKFDSAILLEKHFRVHGGAFLLANLKARRSIQSV